MLKILFVDDDAIARRSMTSKIEWNLYGWDLIYTAKDALDALDFMKHTEPEIVLSDIKMPVIDGIQMAMIAQNYYPDIKYIFLSGYKEFEYAKQALKLNAVDYLNKPIDKEHLIQVIKEAEILYLESQRTNLIMRDKYPFMSRHLLSQLMAKHFREIDDSVFRAFDLNLSNGFGAAGFLEFQLPSSDIAPSLYTHAEDLCHYLSAHFHGSIFINMENLQIFFIFTASNLKNIEEFSAQKALLERHCHDFLRPFPDYGTIIENLNDLYLSYESILNSIRSNTSDLLEQVKTYLEENYSRADLTLTQIADHFYVNHCYLTSIFKKEFGINLYDYLIQTRLKKAAQLAASTRLKVYEIAEAVGYKNSQYFSVSFKKQFGVTVQEYRNSPPAAG